MTAYQQEVGISPARVTLAFAEIDAQRAAFLARELARAYTCRFCKQPTKRYHAKYCSKPECCAEYKREGRRRGLPY